jgi:hypothetical protein
MRHHALQVWAAGTPFAAEEMLGEVKLDVSALVLRAFGGGLWSRCPAPGPRAQATVGSGSVGAESVAAGGSGAEAAGSGGADAMITGVRVSERCPLRQQLQLPLRGGGDLFVTLAAPCLFSTEVEVSIAKVSASGTQSGLADCSALTALDGCPALGSVLRLYTRACDVM